MPGPLPVPRPQESLSLDRQKALAGQLRALGQRLPALPPELPQPVNPLDTYIGSRRG